MKAKILSAALLSFLLYCGNKKVADQSRAIDVQGHRGARGLAPENTWLAFMKALELGVTTLEFDTMFTKDRKLIIHHDLTVNTEICQHSDPKKKAMAELILNMNLREIKKLDCGSLRHPKFPQQESVPNTRIITLEEFFKKMRDYEKKQPVNSRKVFFNIEVKIDPDDHTPELVQDHVRELLKIVENYSMLDRTIIQSFVLSALKESKKLKQNVKTAALFDPFIKGALFAFVGLYLKDFLEKTLEAQADILSPHYTSVSFKMIQKAHEKNIRVIPYTVNDVDKMKELILWGVDGIITDYPDRLCEVSPNSCL